MEQRFLFICGVGRSGTTELARVLSAHPEIVLGIERYKRLWRPDRIGNLTPARFEKDRFFDFSEGLTNITPRGSLQWEEHYAVMAAKFDAATYVGDKMTQLRVRELKPAFPEAKFIIIIRNIYDVAYSWDQRAKRSTDPWPETHDAVRAVPEWNKGLQRLADYLDRYGDAVAYVEYEDFFSDPQGRELNRLLSYLDLKPDARLARRFSQARKTYDDRIASKDRSLDRAVTAFIARNANLDLWNRLCPDNGRFGAPARVQGATLADGVEWKTPGGRERIDTANRARMTPAGIFRFIRRKSGLP